MSHDQGHPDFLQHHFDSPQQQFDSGKLGMWLFLATEILLFGGLFVAYAIYRANHPEIFDYAHTFLDTKLGAINTVILLCSSLTMAWGVRAAQLGQRKLLIVLLCCTIAGGFGFMGIKFVEYQAKFEHGTLWAKRYVSQEHHGEDHGGALTPGGEAGHAEEGHADDAAPEADHAAPATDHQAEAEQADAFEVEHTMLAAPAPEPSGLARAETHDDGAHTRGPEPENVQVFFSIYFLMTGLHGAHVLIGMLAIAWVLVKAVKGQFSSAYFTPVDLVGLYWHLVDLIWIFLFPLLYLIR
ncbi:MAG: cytochrome c oxidase subunit 3 family protein [bacterium]|nr:cytochrome c oxidase subunit 3 family protein [bacterium]